ncbi:unnamed protein product [Orchesella dallaii]|uniref:Uncharacterized protein n=1 Tax=Orchesella dallaii TaxID=48710 RepID=A0ABP1RSM9_9HEXA
MNKYEVNSSTKCVNFPKDIQLEEGSVRTTECVAIYVGDDCYNDEFGFVISSEEKSLRNLLDKLVASHSSRSPIKIRSLRDCTVLEASSFANMDYYVKPYKDGVHTQFRNICDCTRLPFYDELDYQHAVYTYGNCFTFYESEDCTGDAVDKLETIQHNYLFPGRQSFKPCSPPMACGRYVEIYKYRD